MAPVYDNFSIKYPDWKKILKKIRATQ
jgi:hypothetical protein